MNAHHEVHVGVAEEVLPLLVVLSELRDAGVAGVEPHALAVDDEGSRADDGLVEELQDVADELRLLQSALSRDTADTNASRSSPKEGKLPSAIPPISSLPVSATSIMPHSSSEISCPSTRVEFPTVAALPPAARAGISPLLK